MARVCLCYNLRRRREGLRAALRASAAAAASASAAAAAAAAVAAASASPAAAAALRLGVAAFGLAPFPLPPPPRVAAQLQMGHFSASCCFAGQCCCLGGGGKKKQGRAVIFGDSMQLWCRQQWPPSCCTHASLPHVSLHLRLSHLSPKVDDLQVRVPPANTACNTPRS